MQMNMTDYQTLHLDTNQDKGTTCSMNEFGCKWTWETIHYYT